MKICETEGVFAKQKQKIAEFLFNERYEGAPSFSRTFVRGKHSAWAPTAKMAAQPRTVLACQLRQSGRSPAAKPLPLLAERRIRWEETKQKD